MPLAPRVIVPGEPHHVTQRGNNRQAVFLVDDDYRAYLAILGEQAERYGLNVRPYCLMGNHVHLVAVPSMVDSLSKGVGRTNLRYALRLNRLHGRSGHLWQDRFWSCPLDNEHYWSAVTYVERNPVRAKLVRLAWRYPWSSAAHCDGRDRTGLLDLASWEADKQWEGDWRDALRRDEDDATVARLRTATMRNRPLGSGTFLSNLEALLGRRLRARPRKKQEGTNE